MRTFPSTAIWIDAHTLGCRQTGNEIYTYNLINQLEKYSSGVTCDVFCGPRADRTRIPAGVSVREVSSNPFVRLGWDIPNRLRRHPPDVLHVQYTAPLRVAAAVVVTIHDVSFLEEPGFFHPLRAAQLRHTVRRTVASAARIITPSEFSRQAVLRNYVFDPAKVVTIPNGVSRRFQPMDRAVSRRWIARKFGIHAPFILAVGNLEARKNLLGLVHAFEALMCRYPNQPHHLVFAGQQRWKGGEVRNAAVRSARANRIHFTDYVDDSDLAELYSACDLLVQPSFYEGFGLPILEAMASGRAVACSNTTAMPEVAGNAAQYFDPQSADDMASAMASLLTDPEKRRRFERAGVERARGFSWARTASMTMDVYRAAALTNQTRREEQHADRTLLSSAAR